MAPGRPLLRHLSWCPVFKYMAHEKKKSATVTAHGELTVSSRWPKWWQPAVTEPWPGPWLSCDLAMTEPWSYWRCRDWAVTSPWLSYDLAVTELWPRRDWAVTSPSRDWAVIIGPRSRDHRGHCELTVTIYFLMGVFATQLKIGKSMGVSSSNEFQTIWQGYDIDRIVAPTMSTRRHILLYTSSSLSKNRALPHIIIIIPHGH